MTTQITMADYSAKAFILYGEGTKSLKDKLKTIGGRYNPLLKLNGQQVKGWVFSKSRKEAVSLLLSEVKEEKPVEEIKAVIDTPPAMPVKGLPDTTVPQLD